MALVRSHCQELNGLGTAHLEAPHKSALVKPGKSVLRLGISFLGRLPVPLGRLGVALLHALVIVVPVAQSALRIGTPLLGRLPVPLGRGEAVSCEL